MADIVEELRTKDCFWCKQRNKEAADTIDKLRAALDKMKRSRDRYRQAWENEKTRAALKENSDG